MDSLKAIPHFIIRSFLPANTLNFKDILFVLKLPHLDFDVFFFQLVVDLLLGLLHELLTYMLSFEFLLFKGEVQFPEGLIGNYVDGLSVLHDTCNEQFVVGKLIDFGQVKFKLLGELGECQIFGSTIVILYLHFHGLWFWLRDWDSLSVVSVRVLVVGVHLIHSFEEFIVWVWVDIHFGTSWFFGLAVLRVNLFTLKIMEKIPSDTLKTHHRGDHCQWVVRCFSL